MPCSPVIGSSLSSAWPTSRTPSMRLSKPSKRSAKSMEGELERRHLERKERPAIPADNQAACPRCGRWGRYRATEARQLVTRHGEHALARRRYYCRRCHQGFVPLDHELDLDRGET